MEKRFIQAHREAFWSFWLAVAYLACWALSAWLPDDVQGVSGLPHWFEIACLLVPGVFIVLCWLMVRVVFRDIPLEDDSEA
ncbi:YhdT family protein [Pseudomonas cerasi]